VSGDDVEVEVKARVCTCVGVIMERSASACLGAASVIHFFNLLYTSTAGVGGGGWREDVWPWSMRIGLVWFMKLWK
jgi:hypothetical protein